MRKFWAMIFTAALAASLLAGAASAATGDGLMRVVIKGQDVNLRWYPDTRDDDAKAGRASAGTAFIAEAVEVERYGSESDPRWYRLLCPADEIADGWTPRLVSARFAEKMPLSADDIKALASFSYGKPAEPIAMASPADYVKYGPRAIARDLADFASRYGGKAESFYTNEFPGMVTQSAEADGVEVWFRHSASDEGISTRVLANVSRPGLSMGELVVGKTTRDEARSLLGEPDEPAPGGDMWGETNDLSIGYDAQGVIEIISVQSEL